MILFSIIITFPGCKKKCKNQMILSNTEWVMWERFQDLINAQNSYQKRFDGKYGADFIELADESKVDIVYWSITPNTSKYERPVGKHYWAYLYIEDQNVNCIDGKGPRQLWWCYFIPIGYSNDTKTSFMLDESGIVYYRTEPIKLSKKPIGPFEAFGIEDTHNGKAIKTLKTGWNVLGSMEKMLEMRAEAEKDW